MERGDSTKLRVPTAKLRIPKPTRHAYINFVQDFRQTYKGTPRTSPQMVALAAQTWRGMGERQRAPYEAVAAEERLKPRQQPTRKRRLDRLRSQVRLLKEEVMVLKTKEKQLKRQGHRTRALRQRHQKRKAPKTTRVRKGFKRPKRQVKKTRRVARRPRALCAISSSSSCNSF